MALLRVSAHARSHFTGRGWAGFWLLASALLALAGPDALAQTKVTPEYEVKAVFLFNFARFVDWPPEAFAGPQAPLVIGVLGEDPFDGFLDDTVRGEQVNHRSLIVRRYRHVEEIETCHILFISQSEAHRLNDILARLNHRSILIVGDSEGFAQRGGMIRFVTEESRIRFRINQEAAEAAHLIISSKLLQLAKVAGPGKD